MKTYTLFNVLLICCIQSILAFSQSQLPKNAIIVANDGSGKYNTVIIRKFRQYKYFFLLFLKLLLFSEMFY